MQYFPAPVSKHQEKILENKDGISLYGLHAPWLLKQQQTFIIKLFGGINKSDKLF